MSEARAVIRRRGAKTATPYLRRWMPEFGHWDLPGLAITTPEVLDLGCGDGRNSDYLRNLGCRVKSYDMDPDYVRAVPPAWMAGQDSIPDGSARFDLVLCQYLLMFLSDDEIYHLLLEIERVTKPNGYVLFELQKIKSGRDVELSKVINFFLDSSHLTVRQQQQRGRWEVFHQAKNRCIMRYIHNSKSTIFAF